MDTIFRAPHGRQKANAVAETSAVWHTEPKEVFNEK
jgi:hypothetical protein